MSIFSACVTNNESNDGEVNSDPSYDMLIEGLGHFENGKKTEWNLSSGIAVLGPEETGEPLARLQFTISQGSSASNASGVANISSAILSWSNLRSVGSGNPSTRDCTLWVVLTLWVLMMLEIVR
jgi:hypothetical protein